MSEQRSYPTNNPQSFPSAGTPPNPDAITQANEQYAEYHEQRRTAAFENKVQVRALHRLTTSIIGSLQQGDVAWCSPQQAQQLIDAGHAEYAGEGEAPAGGQSRVSDTVHANKAYQPQETQAGKDPSPVQQAAAARPTPSSEAKGGPSTASAESKESGKAKP